MNKQIFIISIMALLITAGIAIHFANKGKKVKIGSPLLLAEIN